MFVLKIMYYPVDSWFLTFDSSGFDSCASGGNYLLTQKESDKNGLVNLPKVNASAFDSIKRNELLLCMHKKTWPQMSDFKDH